MGNNFTVSREGRRISANGTSLQGYIDCSYEKLVEIFGEPTDDGDGYKADAEWVIRFEGEIVATIYNYKDGQNYCGAKGTPVENITNWHIGGHQEAALRCVMHYLPDVQGQTNTEYMNKLFG